MDASRVTEILTHPVTVDLIDRSPLMRIAYTGLDGAPRVVPLAYVMRGANTRVLHGPVVGEGAGAAARPARVAITIGQIRAASKLVRSDRINDVTPKCRSLG